MAKSGVVSVKQYDIAVPSEHVDVHITKSELYNLIINLVTISLPTDALPYMACDL